MKSFITSGPVDLNLFSHQLLNLQNYFTCFFSKVITGVRAELYICELTRLNTVLSYDIVSGSGIIPCNIIMGESSKFPKA